MKVLVVVKTTAFDSQGEYIRKMTDAGRLPEHHLKRLKRAHDEHYHTLEVLRSELTQGGVEFQEVSRGRYWPDMTDYEAIIAVGGDGTVLEASHHLEDDAVGMIGVRSSGMSVGHLCACGGEKLDILVGRILNRQIGYVHASRLRARVTRVDETTEIISPPVLNDFLYSSINPAETTRYELSMNGKNGEVQKSSGIWFATPAGSTAACYASGGEALDMNSDLFQYVVRELYRPTPPESRYPKGLFDPDQEILTVENYCETAILAFDGQHGMLRLSFGDTFSILRATPLRVARPF